jgi:hypothetical protein
LVGVPQVLFPKKELVLLHEPDVLPGQGAVLPSASGGNATPRSHLANEFHQIQFVNYNMSVTFFVIVKSVKKY